MRSSETTAAIGEALALCLSELKNPAKTKRGGGGAKTYRYAELPDILDAIRPELAKCLLSLTMEAVTDGPTVGVGARLLHASGEWLEYGPLMLPAGSDAQSAGSALTYSRRYLVCAILNIAADEDDDGKRAAAPASHPAGSKSSDGEGPRPSARSSDAAAKRPTGEPSPQSEPGPVSSEGLAESGNLSGEVDGEAGASDGTPLGPSASPEPHDHVPGAAKPLASGKVLCGICGKPYRPAPTVHTAPVDEAEQRKDIA